MVNIDLAVAAEAQPCQHGHHMRWFASRVPSAPFLLKLLALCIGSTSSGSASDGLAYLLSRLSCVVRDSEEVFEVS